VLAEVGKDMIVDQPSEGTLGIGAADLASFETLVPLFEGMNAGRSSISSM
jgi:hypothetical protein